METLGRLSKILPILVVLASTISGCGTTTGTGLTGNVTIQSNPLAGPNAAFLERGLLKGIFRFFRELSFEPNAYAGVSSFNTFKVCNDTFLFVDGNGNTLSLNGSASSKVGPGLLTFSPTSTSPMVIGSLDIQPGTVIQEIDVTLAVVPSLCQGANYAVEFDGGSGVIDITQNTAFKFSFSGTPLTVGSGAQTVTLLLGQIVDGMVSLGSNLNNSTIQTVNAGQAR